MMRVNYPKKHFNLNFNICFGWKKECYMILCAFCIVDIIKSVIDSAF